ncbi:MAG: transglycosylase SLT domain-containing protein [Acidobacteriota bacterium]
MSNKPIKTVLTFCCIGIATLLGSSVLLSFQSPDASIASSSYSVQVADMPLDKSEDPEYIYRALAESRGMFEQGLRLVRDGHQDRGKKVLESAQDRLFEGLRKCADISSCDIEVFFDAIAELRQMRQLTYAQDASENVDLKSKNRVVENALNDFAQQPDSGIQPPASQILFRGKDLRELIELNDPIKASLNDWLTWMRPQLMETYENYQYLRDKIAPIYEEAGLPEALLFGVIATETGGKVHAVSSAGATGLMQFMQGTGKKYGLTMKDGFDMRLDPIEATRANVAYMNDQLEILNQNLEKALAAYNGGENRLRRLDRKFRGVDFWDSRFYNALPNETRKYVPRILAAAWLFLHPQDYNLQFKSFPTDTITLTLQQETSLDQLSICLGQSENQRNGWFRTLRNLNPELEYNDPIAAGESLIVPSLLKQDYEKNCLGGELVARARELHEARFPEIIVYTVVKGDSLIKISKRFNCSVTTIASLNNLRAPKYVIRIGQNLKIPSYP